MTLVRVWHSADLMTSVDSMNQYLQRYPSWEAVSISHAFPPVGGVTVYVLLKQIGARLEGEEFPAEII